MSSFLSASKIFLIVTLLDSPCLSNTPSVCAGALRNTFPMLFQLKIFLIYSDQFVLNPLVITTPQNYYLIRWRLLLSGFRSVLVNATDKPL